MSASQVPDRSSGSRLIDYLTHSYQHAIRLHRQNDAGDIQTGHISAADVEAVKRALREQSLFLIDVRKKAGELAVGRQLFGWRERAALSKRDLLSVTTQLAIMTRSGVDLASAFQSLSQQCGNADVAEYLGPGSPRRDGRQEHFRRHAGAGGGVRRRLRGQRGGRRSGRQAAGSAWPAGAVSAHGNSRAGDGPHAAGVPDAAVGRVVAGGDRPGDVRAAEIRRYLRPVRSSACR